MSTALQQNAATLANILMQRRQFQAQQQERQNQQAQQERISRLSDLQYKRLEREDDYQTGLQSAMANPQSTSTASIAPQAQQTPQLSLASLGNQMQPQQFQPTGLAPASPTVQAYNEGRIKTDTVRQTPGQAGAQYAMLQGNFADAAKLLTLDDAFIQKQAQGDPVKYAQAKQELEQGAKFFEIIKPYAKNPAALKQVWPQVQQMFPQQTAGITPDSIISQGNSVIMPLEMNGQIVPGKATYSDDDGKMHIIDIAPKGANDKPFAREYDDGDTRVTELYDAGGKLTGTKKAPRYKPTAASDAGNGGKPPKPLPVSALKMQTESTDAIGTASGISADLGVIRQQVSSGAIDLGPMKNLWNKGRNWAGWSSPESRNLATFKNTLEKLRNDSLRLNKGVQTDGDAQRAWNELIDNINDPGVVKQRLAEIDRINERAVTLHQANIDNIRNNYGQAPLDTSAQTSVKPALGKAPAGATGGKDKRPPLSAIFGTKKR